jgi:transcriptional/translational regulatory protein YebC/TACO1
MFQRKSVFELEMTEEMDLEELEFNLIDAGVEELEVQDGALFVYGDYTAFGTISKALEDLGLEAQKSGLKRYATSPVEFSEEQLVDIEKMLDKIEDDDDIQQVFTNIA